MTINNQAVNDTVDKICAGGTFCESLGIYPKEGEPTHIARHGVTV